MRRQRKRSSSSYTDMDNGDRESAVDAGAHVMDISTQFISRAALSALAIGMLWCSSLSVITKILHESNLLPIPSVNEVVRGTVALYNETIDLRRTYLDCVEAELSVCNATLVRRRNTEAERSENARRANADTRDRSREVQGKCAAAHARAMASVSAWQRQQGASASMNATNGSATGGSVTGGVTSHYSASCKDEERRDLVLELVSLVMYRD